MLSEEMVKELQQILKEDYGLELSAEETLVIGNALVGYYRILLEVFEQDLKK